MFQGKTARQERLAGRNQGPTNRITFMATWPTA